VKDCYGCAFAIGGLSNGNLAKVPAVSDDTILIIIKVDINNDQNGFMMP
jgi:hypothetical protein